MLDRESELEVIRTAITTVSTGSGSALIVEGVAGIGKTRLLAQGGALGERAGLRILRASCGEFEATYPWGMVRQVFDCIVRDDSGGPRRFLRDAGRLALPALGLAVAAGGRKDDEFALLHGLYWLTADMARESPLLIAVDDLHWSDRSSLRFVAYLIRRLEGLPVLLMVSARPPRPTGQREHGDPGHVLASIRADGRRRPDKPANRPGPLRYPADRGDSPDQHLRQTRDQLPARVACRAGHRRPGRVRRLVTSRLRSGCRRPVACRPPGK